MHSFSSTLGKFVEGAHPGLANLGFSRAAKAPSLPTAPKEESTFRDRVAAMEKQLAKKK